MEVDSKVLKILDLFNTLYPPDAWPPGVGKDNNLGFLKIQSQPAGGHVIKASI